MSFLEGLPYPTELKHYVCIIVIGVSSGVLLYYIFEQFKKGKNRQPPEPKPSKKSNDLVVSLFANKTILNEDDFSVIGDNLKLFLSICAKTRAYVIVQVPDEDKIEVALKALEDSGAFAGGLAKHRVMFCKFPSGRVSMVQQLQPHLHVEASREHVEFVNTKLQRQNVTTFDNMESILNCKTPQSDSSKIS